MVRKQGRERRGPKASALVEIGRNRSKSAILSKSTKKSSYGSIVFRVPLTYYHNIRIHRLPVISMVGHVKTRERLDGLQASRDSHSLSELRLYRRVIEMI